jgi:hypothetical protein
MLLKVKYIIIFNIWGKKKPKENYVNYRSLAIPMSMSNNIPISPITENINNYKFTNNWKYINDWKHSNGW